MGKAKKGGKRITKRQLSEMLVNFFSANPERVYTFKEIFRALHLDTHPAKMLAVDTMEEMAWDDFLVRTSINSYQLNTKGQVQEGVFRRKSNGKNSFVPSDGEQPIFVSERNSMGALDGDKVRVSVMARRQNHIKEAKVIEILERKKDTFVGKLVVGKDIAFLKTNDNLARDILIPKKRLKKGQTDDKAVVKIVSWPDEEHTNMIGEVVDILGKCGDNDVEMNTILAQYGLPYRYPKAVEDAADKITGEITKQDEAEREDFRNTWTCTIDPKDAKDFDDALSIKRLDNGLWEVGVHIADVSHYVKDGSVIDKEAVKRATSVYLVDRTIPMLPERLCNFICSLRPDEEKLAYSVIFTINEKAEVKDYRIRHTVIKSNRRFTYEEAQEIIETGKGEYKDEILELNKLAQILREKRMANGAINFDRCEVKFEIDENGKPLSVYFKESKEANKLIEEFMLLANRTVAEHIGKVPKNKKPKVFPYRIHDLPDPDKLESLSQFIARFGYKIRTGGTKTEVSKSINRLLNDIEGKKEQNLIETVSLRAMQKARYSIHNIGHYGLAFDYYTHFTSPIRRYPDLMVHRLLTRYLAGGRTAQADKYEELCEHSSAMEQTAAERASVKYKQVEFMGERIGNVYDGVISGVTEWGLYVEINENKCEGMVPMRDLGDDYYEFDEKNYCLIGRKRHQKFSLGDPVQIKVARANLEKKQLDFVLADDKLPIKK